MQITTHIRLDSDEYAANLAGNATELAEAILTAVGGDENADTSTVHIQDFGLAGMVPPTLPPPTIESSPEPIPPPTPPPPPPPTS